MILAGLDHWEVVCSGGDGFAVEESPAGCKQLAECAHSVKGRSSYSCSIHYAVITQHVHNVDSASGHQFVIVWARRRSAVLCWLGWYFEGLLMSFVLFKPCNRTLPYWFRMLQELDRPCRLRASVAYCSAHRPHILRLLIIYIVVLCSLRRVEIITKKCELLGFDPCLNWLPIAFRRSYPYISVHFASSECWQDMFGMYVAQSKCRIHLNLKETEKAV